MQPITNRTRYLSKLGFTLIELLVAVAIIGILLSASVASYVTAQKQGRDSRRKEDIANSQKAFEQYYAENNTYPIGANIDSAFQSGTRPTDPKNSGTFVYSWTYTASDGYCICAAMETSTGNADSPTSTSCTWNASGAYHCAASQQ